MENLFQINVRNLRSERQRCNDQIVFNLLTNKTSIDKITNQCNIMALDRLLSEEKISYNDLLDKCKDPFLCRSISRNISINASRQGKIDEKLIIDGVSSTMAFHGFKIRGCGVNEIRFCKDGRVLDARSFKKEKLDKDKDSLKSVDGIIGGKINGYIFAKVVIGEGGHQDNVLSESITFINWVNKFGENDKLYVILIDGEDLSKIKEYEKNNLWIVNHIEFQERLIKIEKKN